MVRTNAELQKYKNKIMIEYDLEDEFTCNYCRKRFTCKYVFDKFNFEGNCIVDKIKWVDNENI